MRFAKGYQGVDMLNINKNDFSSFRPFGIRGDIRNIKASQVEKNKISRLFKQDSVILDRFGMPISSTNNSNILIVNSLKGITF